MGLWKKWLASTRCYRWILAAAVLVVLLPVGACEGQRRRPHNVPASASWVGGVDGGVFVTLRPEGRAGLYRAVIYNETDGDVLFRGRLVADPSGKTKYKAVTPDALDGWDGDNLLLRDGGRLRKAEK